MILKKPTERKKQTKQIIDVVKNWSNVDAREGEGVAQLRRRNPVLYTQQLIDGHGDDVFCLVRPSSSAAATRVFSLAQRILRTHRAVLNLTTTTHTLPHTLSSHSTPPQAEEASVPVLYWLSGLTCTHENFITKAGATRAAAARGVMLVMPFTSPPEQEWEAAWYAEKGIEKSWDFGYKASMYVDATEAPWSTGGYRMHEYITQELPQLIEANFAALPGKKSIFGHSMGGHGALICAMRNPGAYASASAFSPICNPARAPWGLKSFTHYLGADEAKWAEWDACALASEYAADAAALPILVDQGEADSFLVDGQLLPEALVAACDAPANITLELRMQPGYDHSYIFISLDCMTEYLTNLL